MSEGLHDLIRVIGEDTVQPGLVGQEMHGILHSGGLKWQLVCA
jgi:hypothetical protein